MKILSILLFLSDVNRVKTIVSLLLLAFWLPASSHALLQYAGLIHQRHADHDADSTGSHEHNTDDHDAADGHCILSSPHVSVPLPDAKATPSLFRLLGLEWTSELHIELQPSGLAPPGPAPPQLSQRWQFSFRTALSPRAPSVIS